MPFICCTFLTSFAAFIFCISFFFQIFVSQYSLKLLKPFLLNTTQVYCSTHDETPKTYCNEQSETSRPRGSHQNQQVECSPREGSLSVVEREACSVNGGNNCSFWSTQEQMARAHRRSVIGGVERCLVKVDRSKVVYRMRRAKICGERRLKMHKFKRYLKSRNKNGLKFGTQQA